MKEKNKLGWRFWVDRGGTFTDIIALSPKGEWLTHKLLSSSKHYKDGTLYGIRHLLNQYPDLPHTIEEVRMGTTIATNALLERKGVATGLVTTKGFKDGLTIGYQNRPDVFARQIIRPEPLYQKVVEIEERMANEGEVLKKPKDIDIKNVLLSLKKEGIESIAVVFIHGYRYPQHEQKVAEIAKEIGFQNISLSHEVSPLIRYVSRGETTVLDAYLTPLLTEYVSEIEQGLRTRIFFMQSNGGLVESHYFRGKEAILSGPAGGIIGAIKTAEQQGFSKIVTFDMGGTSTDVAYYGGIIERKSETEIGGVKLRTPMLKIHTIAAGGGSILSFDGIRYKVGPDSAGAQPGPASYGHNGPLTVTDCNLLLLKIQKEFFPFLFGEDGKAPLNDDIVRQKFNELQSEITNATGEETPLEEIAEGFLKVAIDHMANAIKKISIADGHDLKNVTLSCFGGAGGQHACLVADELGIKQIFIHHYASLLSALGIGFADLRWIGEQAVEKEFNKENLEALNPIFKNLEKDGSQLIQAQMTKDQKLVSQKLYRLRYHGTDATLEIVESSDIKSDFEKCYQIRYGFLPKENPIVIESIAVEVIGQTLLPLGNQIEFFRKDSNPQETKFFSQGKWQKALLYHKEVLRAGEKIKGPAILIESNTTIIVEPSWEAEILKGNHILLRKIATLKPEKKSIDWDPILLEIFNNRFMAIAEQMGVTLANTAYSVNIKERLDFSCALFDAQGGLVANAPHMPVHLGSMGESVRTILRLNKVKKGDVYCLNAPYNGGTHLPDVTVISPVFDKKGEELLFIVASRGHQADIGGITPGSMPPMSKTVHEEGILIDNFKLVDQGRFQEEAFRELLTSGNYPARNVEQNVADIKAQLAANAKGIEEIHHLIDQFGKEVVQAYMRYIQNNADAYVRAVVDKLEDGQFEARMDNGLRVCVSLKVNHDKREVVIDFSGTSPQTSSNFNAPFSVTRAAVLYVMRTMIDAPIPLNEGCMRAIHLIVPEDSFLRPKYPGAVVAGNVETSQIVTDALYAALGVMASAQGTMNNFTFGNENYQYYETICGGAGAGPDFDGCDAIHTHMTNSRLTDVEVLELRFPVLVHEFSIRPHSGGKGLFRGGNGVKRVIEFREPMTASILSNHRVVSPHGLKGGENGALGKTIWIQKNGVEHILQSADSVFVEKGDKIQIETPGGGGFGRVREK